MPPSVRLEPLGEGHVADVAKLLDDPEVLRFTRIREPPPSDFAKTWVARYDAGRLDGTIHVKHGIRRDATLWSRLPTDPAPA
jgi:hypothetical protein